MPDARVKSIQDAILARLAAIAAGATYSYTVVETGSVPVGIDSQSRPAAYLGDWDVLNRAYARLGDAASALHGILRQRVRAMAKDAENLPNFCLDIVRSVEGDTKDLGLAYVSRLHCVAVEAVTTQEEIAGGHRQADVVFEISYSMQRGQL